MVGHTAILLLSVLLVSAANVLSAQDCQHCDHTIYADSQCSTKCKSNGTTTCGNLTEAVETAKNCTAAECGPIRIKMSPGCFHFGNDSAVFGGINNFTLVGSDDTIVSCVNPAVFGFINSSNITIQDIRFHGCGAVQRQHNYQFSAALYFVSCNSLTLTSVSIVNSQGTGMVIYNTGGRNVFDRCTFSLSKNVTSLGDGGGVAIEFSTENTPDIADSYYKFLQCRFEKNAAIAPGYERIFGVGGGMSVQFKGAATSNIVHLDTCVVAYNIAERGNGLYINFILNSQNNTVLVENSNITSNSRECDKGIESHEYAAGGGAKIAFDQYMGYSLGPDQHIPNNTVKFIRTRFTENLACLGGGVSVSAARELTIPPTNSLVFQNCTFLDNEASLAAAIDLSILHPDPGSGTLMKSEFEDCTFTGNKNNRVGQWPSMDVHMGTVYVNGLPIEFTGVTVFADNYGTALVIAGAGAQVSNHSSMVFQHNSGRRGGALAFIGEAWMMVHYMTQFVFKNNTAVQMGGAIYAVHFGEHDLVHEKNCFIRYFDLQMHPDDWNASFSFIDNHAGSHKGCSIYTTSTLPCVMPSGLVVTNQEIMRVFHWNNWSYEGTNCSIHVATAPAKFSKIDEYLFNKTVFPGQIFHLPIQTYNDYNQSLDQAVFSCNIKPDQSNLAVIAPSSQYTANNNISVFGSPNENVTVLVETLDPRVISTEVIVTIQPCPPGFTPQYYTPPEGSNETVSGTVVSHCICGTATYFKCLDDYRAMLLTGNCMTYESDGGNYSEQQIVIGKCPYCHYTHPFVLLPQYASELEDQICGEFKRAGRLCGECKKGYGVAVDDDRFKCVKCDEYTYKWLAYYIAIEFLPITIFFIIVAFFHISATSAPMNAFVFFSQITAIPYFRNRYPWSYGLSLQHQAIKALFLFPYNIWNLDFKTVFPDFCLSPKLSTIHILVLGYVSALYPLFLILLCYIVIELYDRTRTVRWLCTLPAAMLRKFRRSWEPKTSIIDVFATFLLLSYCKLTFVSFSILTPSYVYDANGDQVGSTVFYYDANMDFFSGQHLIFALIAIVILATFVAIPPLFLLIYPFKCFQKCINACHLPWQPLHTFADAFQGCFKDSTCGKWDCRYFAAIYFILRIVFFVIYTAEKEFLLQYVGQQILCTFAIVLFATVQPYKQRIYNYLDVGIFILLSVLNSLSFYNCAYLLSNSEINNSVFWINYILLFLPLLYIISFVLYHFLRWKNPCRMFLKKLSPRRGIIRGSSYHTVAIEDGDSSMGTNYGDDEVPDRLLNPQNYDTQSRSRGVSRLWSTEGALAAKARYGSIPEGDGPYSDSAVHGKAKKFHKFT